MSQETNVTQPTVDFRFGEKETFKVGLKFEGNNKNLPDESTLKFFDYLKSLSLISPKMDFKSWYRGTPSITILSRDKRSFKIRKKAEILGLDVYPGEYFRRKRESAIKSVYMVH